MRIELPAIVKKVSDIINVRKRTFFSIGFDIASFAFEIANGAIRNNHVGQINLFWANALSKVMENGPREKPSNLRFGTSRVKHLSQQIIFKLRGIIFMNLRK
jgi:hypothetical protein